MPVPKAKPFPFTQEYLQNILHYNRVTGIFTWRYRPDKPVIWNAAWAGKEAGTPHSKGYVGIAIDYKYYKAHRLAWFYEYGEQPAEIDHEDTIKNHNWITNLRVATGSQNKCNVGKYKNNSTGYKGVYLLKYGRYQAKIQIKGRRFNLGIYDTPEEASRAYICGAKRLHGKFARWSTNRPRKLRPMGSFVMRRAA